MKLREGRPAKPLRSRVQPGQMPMAMALCLHLVTKACRLAGWGNRTTSHRLWCFWHPTVRAG